MTSLLYEAIEYIADNNVKVTSLCKTWCVNTCEDLDGLIMPDNKWFHQSTEQSAWQQE